MLRYVIGPLAAQSISGTVRMVMKAMESTAAANANLAMAIKIIQPSGADRATLLAVTSSDAASSPYEIATSLNTKFVYTSAEVEPLTLTTQSASAGDYLVIEIGFRSATGTSRNISLRYGDNGGSDFAYTDSLTTDLNPWVEFSANLTWYEPNKYLYAGTGIFNENGQNALLLDDRKLFANTGAIVETGYNAILFKAWRILASTGGFALSGTDAILLDYRKILGEIGSFTVTGLDAILTYYQLTNYLLQTTVGEFNLSGSNALLLEGHKLYSAAGVFIETGQNAYLLYKRQLLTSTGIFTETGNDVYLLRGQKILASAGIFALSGNNAILGAARQIRTETGAFILTGYDAILTYGLVGAYLLQTIPGAFTLIGQDSRLLDHRLILATTNEYKLAGSNALLLNGRTILAAIGIYNLIGLNAILLKQSLIITVPIDLLDGMDIGLFKALFKKVNTP